MKEIKLKPKLEEGERINFLGHITKVNRDFHGNLYVNIPSGINKNLYQSVHINEAFHDIFESAAKCNLLQYGDEDTFCKKCDPDTVQSEIKSPPECEHLMGAVCIQGCNSDACFHPQKAKCIKPKCDFEGGTSIPERTDHFRGVTKMVHQSEDKLAGIYPPVSVAEEKTPLKLRVGGIYRNRAGTIKKIREYLFNSLNNEYKYVDESGLAYLQNGTYGELGDHPFDLIEEVQPEIKYCKCELRDQSITIDFNRYTHKLKCNRCNLPYGSVPANPSHEIKPEEDPPLKDWRQQEIEELEALRKENEELKQISTFHDREIEETRTLCKQYMEQSEKFKNQKNEVVEVWKTQKQELDAMHKENEHLKSQNTELLEAQKKPRDNPFKVGETVTVFAAFMNGDAYEKTGVVTAIKEKILTITFPDCFGDFHYKQCEKVEG